MMRMGTPHFSSDNQLVRNNTLVNRNDRGGQERQPAPEAVPVRAQVRAGPSVHGVLLSQRKSQSVEALPSHQGERAEEL